MHVHLYLNRYKFLSAYICMWMFSDDIFIVCHTRQIFSRFQILWFRYEIVPRWTALENRLKIFQLCPLNIPEKNF